MKHTQKSGTEPGNTITEVTRRAIIDFLTVGRQWSGTMQEDDFLGRIYDLKRMPTTDYRPDYDNAAKDIWKHRVMNSDSPDDWVFTDDRFDLLFGPDEPFLKFLVETVHPVVRPDSDDAVAMVAEYNSLLTIDGWEIYPIRNISGKPVFGYRQAMEGSQPHLDEAKRVAERLSGHYVARRFVVCKRLRIGIQNSPSGRPRNFWQPFARPSCQNAES